MGRDRDFQENEIQPKNYQEADHDIENDDLFKSVDGDAETVDMDNEIEELKPVPKLKADNQKGEKEIKKIMQEFENEEEKIHDQYTETPEFTDHHLGMEKVNLEQLNEEEKLIQRSLLKEQRHLMEEYEDDRMDLLNMERREEDKMKYASSVMANELLLEENRATIEVRENEARTFRQFAKKEEHLKVRIYKDEGELLNMKKHLRFRKKKARSHLFGGSRDKVYSMRWNQTPTPLEVKILMARKVNEKLDKAHYALNVTIMDGFGGNEIFFKFSKDMINDDYRDKLVHMIKKEEKEVSNGGSRQDSESSSELGSNSDRAPKRRLQAPKAADDGPDRLEFLKQTLKRLENNNENFIDKSEADFDDVSLNSFLMPDVEHKRKRRADFHIDDTVAKQGDTTMKKNLINEYKQVMLNFQKNFSSLQNFDQPIEDEELEFENKVYFMIPHDHIIEPSYIIMFELILLDEKLSSTSDRVVAWGAYPLVNRGKFKVPLIRGKYNPNVDKFKDIEGRYMKNIDEWVCNLYFELRDIKLVE